MYDGPIMITGCGAVGAAGIGVSRLWERVRRGDPGAAWRSVPGAIGPDAARGFAVCALNEPLPAPELRLVRTLDRSVQLAVAAAQEAWDQAGLAEQRPSPERIGIQVGTSRGPVELWSRSREASASGRIRPRFATDSNLACLSGTLALAFGAEGPVATVAAACASSAAAILAGAQQLRLGTADVMLVGGAEAPLIPEVLGALAAAGLLGAHEDPQLTCRPFDEFRNGIVPGEGAAVLILETAASMERRRARPVGILGGWALGNEARPRARLDDSGAGLARRMTLALSEADLAPGDIDYLNCHGTGTVMNDLAEAAAVRSIPWPGGLPPACSSTKAVTGHCMGAGAALEAVICIQALAGQYLPPNAAATHPDPACDLPLVAAGGRSGRIRHAMSNSSGFWGHQASLIFSRA